MRTTSRQGVLDPRWDLRGREPYLRSLSLGEAFGPGGEALELGSFDQSHFIKDFKALVGRSPAEVATVAAA